MSFSYVTSMYEENKIGDDYPYNKRLYMLGEKAKKYFSVSSCTINNVCNNFLYFSEIRICTWFKNSPKEAVGYSVQGQYILNIWVYVTSWEVAFNQKEENLLREHQRLIQVHSKCSFFLSCSLYRAYILPHLELKIKFRKYYTYTLFGSYKHTLICISDISTRKRKVFLYIWILIYYNFFIYWRAFI